MSTSSAQADFRLLKSRVTMAMLLNRYNVAVKQQGKEWRGSCPFCKQEHTGQNGNRNSQRSFAVNLDKETFYCHACKKGGDIIKFVADSEGCTLKEAGLKIQEWFSYLFLDSEPAAETTPEQPLGNHPPEQQAAATADLADLLQAILSELRQIRTHLENRGC